MIQLSANKSFHFIKCKPVSCVKLFAKFQLFIWLRFLEASYLAAFAFYFDCADNDIYSETKLAHYEHKPTSFNSLKRNEITQHPK